MQSQSGITGARTAAHPPFPASNTDAPDAEQDSEIPVLDVSRFARLRAMMSPGGLEHVLSCYLLDAEFQLEEIARAPDLVHAANSARILSNLAAEAGAMAVAVTARRLEEACRRGDARRARRLEIMLRGFCARADRMLRGFLASRHDG